MEIGLPDAGDFGGGLRRHLYNIAKFKLNTNRALDLSRIRPDSGSGLCLNTHLC